MKLLVLFFAYFSLGQAQAAPLEWAALEDGQTLTLTQKITLGNPEPYFPAGTTLRLLSREPLAIPGALLMLFHLTQEPCARPEWEHEMEIITPVGNSEDSGAGVQLAKGCQWDVYLEQKDLGTPSFFAPLE